MNNQDGNNDNVANANGEVNPPNLNDDQLVLFLAGLHRQRQYPEMNQLLTKTGLHITRIQAEAEAEIRAVKAKLEKDVSECIQNAKSELTDLEAQVESCSKELTCLEESKKESLTVAVAIRNALDIRDRVLSYHFSFRENGGKCDEETMQEHQKLETELKALQVGIANNDVQFLKPLVWKESVPAVVDFASIWGKLSKIENDSKEPSGTNHY